MKVLSVLLLVGLLGQGLLAQEIIDPDAEVFEVDGEGTIVVNQPTQATPAINVNTSNVIHNNIPAPQVIQVPAASTASAAQQVVQVAATTAATTVVNPVVTGTTTTTTGTATGTVTGTTTGTGIAGARIGVVPLGSLLFGGLGMGTAGTAGLASLMMPRLLIGR